MNDAVNFWDLERTNAVLDLDRNPYVVGDWSWNAESRPHESIEFEMLRELGPGEEK
jgi:hypothetical protein